MPGIQAPGTLTPDAQWWAAHEQVRVLYSRAGEVVPEALTDSNGSGGGWEVLLDEVVADARER